MPMFTDPMFYVITLWWAAAGGGVARLLYLLTRILSVLCEIRDLLEDEADVDDVHMATEQDDVDG